jgi:nickel/cobalt exporter
VANAWLFIPSYFARCASRLEPWHSKTMMAAFYCGHPGNGQASGITGAVAATISWSVVWLIAFGGMYISQKFTAESAEPGFSWDFRRHHSRYGGMDVLANLARRKAVEDGAVKRNTATVITIMTKPASSIRAMAALNSSIFEEGQPLTGVYARSAARNGSSATFLW